jgi:hypothetical protein
LNYDDRTRDTFYRLRNISEQNSTTGQGYNGLVAAPATGNPPADGAYEARTGVMIWSLGPDGWADFNSKANVGGNKDNIISWK